MSLIPEGYFCPNCEYPFGYTRPPVGSLCPRCKTRLGPGVVQRIRKPEGWTPGVGCAILLLLLGLILPILPGLGSLYVALKGKDRTARALGYAGLGISALWLVVLLVALL